MSLRMSCIQGVRRTVGAMLLATLAWQLTAATRTSRRQQKAEREAAVADSLAFEQARTEAKRDYFYFAALRADLNGDGQKSVLELLRHAQAIDSTSAAVNYSLSEVCLSAGYEEQALALCSRARMIDSTNVWYGMAEAELLKQNKRLPEAIASYERLLRTHPDNIDVCDQLVGLYVAVDSLRPCLRILNHIEEQEGIDQKLTMQKFYLYMQLGEPDSAFAATQRLVDRFPYNARYRIVQGDLMMKAGRLDDAKASYEAALQLDSNNALLWLSMAQYHAAIGEADKADSLFRAALTHPELDLESKIELMEDYLRSTLRNQSDSTFTGYAPEQQQIDTLFATVCAQHPTAAEPYVLQARYLYAIGKPDDAERCYQDAIDLQPDKEEYWGTLLSLQLERAEFDRARITARKALKLHPTMHFAYIALAMADVEDNNYAGAQTQYRNAIEQVPAHKTSLKSRLTGYVGDLYQSRGMMDSAYVCYDEALKLDAENVNVLNNYSYFLSLEGRDLDRAERMISTVVRLKPDEPTYLDTYAWVYFKQGNYTLAKFYQKRAIDRSGEQVTATLLEHYGDILWCSGDVTGAMDYWQRAINMPDNVSTTLDEKIRTATYVEEPFVPGKE